MTEPTEALMRVLNRAIAAPGAFDYLQALRDLDYELRPIWERDEAHWLVGRALGYVSVSQDDEWVKRAVTFHEGRRLVKQAAEAADREAAGEQATGPTDQPVTGHSAAVAPLDDPNDMATPFARGYNLGRHHQAAEAADREAAGAHREATARSTSAAVAPLQGEALIAHTRKQAETVVACLDSLADLWRLQQAAVAPLDVHVMAAALRAIYPSRSASDLIAAYSRLAAEEGK